MTNKRELLEDIQGLLDAIRQLSERKPQTRQQEKIKQQMLKSVLNQLDGRMVALDTAVLEMLDRQPLAEHEMAEYLTWRDYWDAAIKAVNDGRLEQ